MTPADHILTAAVTLSRALAPLLDEPPAPAAAAGDPTAYARAYYAAYLQLAASKPRRVLLVGMNPSLHGQAHTGVPFGDVGVARRLFAGLDLPSLPAAAGIRKPDGALILHARGLEYHRGEQSGGRLWSGLEQICGATLHAVLERCCVVNYCPLVFLDSNGDNVTPEKLHPGPARLALETHCDEHLRTVVAALQAEVVVGIGKYAHDGCRRALAGASDVTAIMRIRHPSPQAGSAQAWFAEAAPVLAAALGV